MGLRRTILQIGVYMKKIIQVSGSVAFDTILKFEGLFSENLPSTKSGPIGLSFFCPEMKKEPGGCAANICYNLSLLEQNCSLLGSFGKDGETYFNELKNRGIDTSFSKLHEDCFTAQAVITTDSGGDQITSFHPGAMSLSGKVGISNLETSYGIVSPNSYDAMLRHATEFEERHIPFIFDPGQALPMFEKKDVLRLIHMASWLTLNEYEGKLLSQILEQDLNSIVKKLNTVKGSAIIQTLGENGARVFTKDEAFSVNAIQPIKENDPTGCGDAFRAGLLCGFNLKHNIQKSVMFGNAMGCVKVEKDGAQNHKISLRELQKMVEENYT